MRVHMIRVVRAEMAASFSGRRGQPRVDSTTTGQRCSSTRGYHAWTKGITVLAARSKANANEQRRSSSAAWPPSCRCAGRRGDARARSPAGTSGGRVKSSHKPPWSRIIRSKRAANEIYARYSSENQRDASIADQFRICREFAQRQGWQVAAEYSDHAVSGATIMRPGFQAMMREALHKKFDIVMAEALDRFSRDQEDTAGLFKRLTFAGVNIVTLAEGDITHLHIGLKGTMNALFLKELAEKTRPGLRGRIELGKAGGGVSFGYRVVKALSDGVVTTGDREIVPEEAATVRRIFNDYRVGASPKQIAKALNAEGVRGPRGALWSPSTIHASPERGIGILHNELYIGRLVWNRQRFQKDPDTGKRVARVNPPSEWITKDVPELRIIDDEVWQAVQTRYASV